VPLKGKIMNSTNLKTRKIKRARNWFRPRRDWHDPMLVLNMSIFNSGTGWNRTFNRVPQRENVWC
jgi:hypothetical protein